MLCVYYDCTVQGLNVHIVYTYLYYPATLLAQYLYTIYHHVVSFYVLVVGAE